MDGLNEIKTALEARIDSLKEEMRHDWLALEERISALEAARDEAENARYAHERAFESRDRDIARLQSQLRDEEYSHYSLEREIGSLKSEVERSRRGW